MIRHFACLLAVLLLLPAGLSAAVSNQHQVAIEAARKWVPLVDAGQYGESWDAAANLFRDSISRTDWVKSLEMVRTPLGDLVSRKLKGTASVTTLPGAPEGEYLIIEFNTSFRNKPSVIETVTSAREADGNWRVAGYFIR
jgi:hypothetical protein